MDTHKIYVGCCMLILNPAQDKVLIAKRKKEPDIDGWQLPGGTVDYANREHVKDAIIREVQEETGLVILNPEFLCVMNTFYYGPERPIHIAFLGQALSEVIPPNPEPHKAEDWHWVALENLPDGKWFRMSKFAIDYYNNHKNNPHIESYISDLDFP